MQGDQGQKGEPGLVSIAFFIFNNNNSDSQILRNGGFLRVDSSDNIKFGLDTVSASNADIEKSFLDDR